MPSISLPRMELFGLQNSKSSEEDVSTKNYSPSLCDQLQALPYQQPLLVQSLAYQDHTPNESVPDHQSISDQPIPDHLSQCQMFCRQRSKSEGAKLTGLQSALKKGNSEKVLQRRVSFADSNGFQLEQIRSFEVDQSEQPEIDIDFDSDFSAPPIVSDNGPNGPKNFFLPGPIVPGVPGVEQKSVRRHRRFVPYFTLPWTAIGKEKTVYSVLEDRKICLESFNVAPFRITGTILVKNLSYHKRVFVRRTFDQWRTYQDFEATYLNSVDSNVDRFRFELQFGFKLPAGTRLEMVFGFEVSQNDGVKQLWDNNVHNNYAFWYCDTTK